MKISDPIKPGTEENVRIVNLIRVQSGHDLKKEKNYKCMHHHVQRFASPPPTIYLTENVSDERDIAVQHHIEGVSELIVPVEPPPIQGLGPRQARE